MFDNNEKNVFDAGANEPEGDSAVENSSTASPAEKQEPAEAKPGQDSPHSEYSHEYKAESGGSETKSAENVPPYRPSSPENAAAPAGVVGGTPDGQGDAAPPAGYGLPGNQPPANGTPGGYYTNQPGTPTGQQPGYGQQWDPNQQAPGQQTQWTFNDYGPIGGPGKPKKEKKPRNKTEKKPGSGNGIKVLAIVMSALFVISVAGFGGYLLYDHNQETESGSDKPSYHIQDSPDIKQNEGDAPSSAPLPIDGSQLSPSALYEAVEPAVVGVVGYVKASNGLSQPASQGSGVVFDENGYIVTNRHVIKNENSEQNYEKIDVIFTTGETYSATVLGSDKETDLAVLKVDATGLRTAVFGDSDKVKVGDQAFVIGNPSGLEYAGSLAGGYISAVNREVYMQSISAKVELIQTDAAINPGNSGGALVNVYGQVIGITSAKLVGEEYEGMGFAIPINNVKPIVESLIDNGYVAGRVQIGLYYRVVDQTIADLNGIPQGLRVVSFFDESDARNKGVLPGDIIYKMDGVEVHDTPDVKKVLLNKNPGESLLLSIYRVDDSDRAQKLEISVTLMEKVAEE